MKVAITGASGFVGTRVRSRFTSHVVIDRDLSVSEIEQRLRGVDAVINLAGAPIIKRWSRSYKDVLYQSRISTTGRLAEALNRTDRNIHLVSASATGIYPEHMACDETCTETANDFLGKLARDWEQQAMLYRGPVSIMRLGVVLGPEGGALSKMLPVFRLGLGGPVGNGGMITSWIDIEDLLRAFEFVIRLGLTQVCLMQWRPTRFQMPNLQRRLPKCSDVRPCSLSLRQCSG